MRHTPGCTRQRWHEGAGLTATLGSRKCAPWTPQTSPKACMSRISRPSCSAARLGSLGSRRDLCDTHVGRHLFRVLVGVNDPEHGAPGMHQQNDAVLTCALAG